MDNCIAELDETATRVAGNPKMLRSAVTNGNRQFAQGGDGRTAWVRRWRDLAALHETDGGDVSTMSEGRKSLCRRAATLEVNLEQLEAHMSEGQGVDLDVYNRLAGNLRRILETLGLERKAVDVSDSAVVAHFRRKQHRPVPGEKSSHYARRSTISSTLAASSRARHGRLGEACCSQ
jgi:hypothetical protein